MDDLLTELEALRIGGDFGEQNSWGPCVDLIQRSLVPKKVVGADRPCEEKDFREYRLVVERNLHNVKSMLQHIACSCAEKRMRLNGEDGALPMARTFGLNLLQLIGEHSEKNVWNTAECINISKELLAGFRELYAYERLSQFFQANDNFNDLLIMLRPKLLKDTWKTYPAAIACYRWILQEAEVPTLFDHIATVLPTALIILDDYVPDNVVIGLECIHMIVQHSYMRKGLIDNGYSEVIHHALKLLSHQKEVRYVVPLYSCIASFLPTIEHWESTKNLYDWTARDDVLYILIDHMRFEQNIELRHAYMSSLPQLLTNVGCIKWCDTLCSLLVEYCEHHTDLKTLKATLVAIKAFLLLFHMRVAAHCVSLYTALIKLHLDLKETPVFDRAIMQDLEDCICLLYVVSRDVGRAVFSDDRMQSLIGCSLPIVCQDNIKYFE